MNVSREQIVSNMFSQIRNTMCSDSFASKTSMNQHNIQQHNQHKQKPSHQYAINTTNSSRSSLKSSKKNIQQRLQQKVLKPKYHNPYSSFKLDKKKKTPSLPFHSLQSKISQTISTDTTWVGDRLCCPEPYCSRIWLQNSNGIDISMNFSSYMEQLQYMKRYDIQFLSTPETKLNSNNSFIFDNIKASHEWVFPEGHVHLSNTKLSRSDIIQYGGVLSSTQGKLSQRYAGSGSDWLGRYHWMDFYGKTRFLRIYTVYRVCAGNDTSSGDDTAWTIQRTSLLEKNIHDDPRDHILTSLTADIKKDIKSNRSVIICADMNENIFKQTGTTFHSAGLHNIFQSLQNSTTHFRSCSGKHVIDGIWVSPDISEYVIRKGFAPFNFMMASDHRGAYCDLDMRMILDDVNHNILPSPYRRLKSTIPARTRVYSSIVDNKWHEYNMDEKIISLKKHFHDNGNTPTNELYLNTLDKQIQEILTHAERNCCKIGRHCIHGWTPQLEQALRKKRHLKIAILNANKSNAPINTIKEILTQYRSVVRDIKFQKKHSISLREALLDQLASDLMTDYPSKYTKKASVIKQIKNCEEMKRNAQKIRRVVKGTQQNGINYVLIPGISSYSTELTSSNKFSHYDVDTIWKRLQIANGKDVSEWERVEDPNLMEKYILEFLKRHFAQASNTPLANIYWKTKLSNKEFQKALLDGSFVEDMSLPLETNQILLSFTNESTTEIKFMPTYEQFKTFIHKAKEKTSASPSSRHYGHYKTLLDRSEQALQGIFSILCLALKYGIILDRWKKTVTALLCKDDNTPYIHRLRPIHIVEVELQFIAKLFWGNLLIKKAEKYGQLTDSQYGGRKSRQAQSSVLNSTITFDYHRQLRCDFTYNDDDLRANYDRELAHFSAAETRKNGLSYEAGKFMINMTQSQKYYIKTKSGTSKNSYQFTELFPIWGLGQGVCWAGSCWQFTATTIANMLSKTCKGAQFTNPSRDLQVSRIIEFFIDDTKKICNTTSSPHKTILEQSVHNMQQHTNLVLSTGGTLALDKCKFYYIKFSFNSNGDPYILPIQDSPGEMNIYNEFSSRSTRIKRMAHEEAHRTLGYFISPSGSSSTQAKVLYDITKEWVTKVSVSNLRGYNVIKAYQSILCPKLTYRFAAMCLSYKECDKLNKITNPVILNAYGIQQHFPRSILESDDEYAGLKTPHFYDLHCIEKLKFFKHHVYQMDYTGKMMVISLQHTQLELGKSESFLNLNYDHYKSLVTSTWSTHLWQYISERDLQIVITPSLTLQPQRANDEFLMDILEQQFHGDDLRTINKIRLHLQLLFLSDVVTISGKRLLPQLRQRKTYRKSNLQWPRQVWKRKWNPLWNKVCNFLQRYSSGIYLGKWQQRYFSCEAEIHSSQKYLRFQQSMYAYEPTTSKQQKFSLSTNVEHSAINQQEFFPADIYIWKNYIVMVSFDCIKVLPYQIQVYCPNLRNEYYLFGGFSRVNEQPILDAILANKAKMCADGSVKGGKGAFAYCLASSGSNILFSQHAPVHSFEPITSTRAELMGLLACVRYLNYIAKKFNIVENKFVLITADNIEAIKSPLRDLSSTKTTFIPDGDIIRELQYWVKISVFRLKFQHVRGHQDNNLPFHELSPLAKLNVCMDKLAKSYFTSPINSPPQSNKTPVFIQDKLSIKSMYDVITSRFATNIVQQHIGTNAEIQFQKTFCITHQDLLEIDWTSFKYFMRSKRGQERFHLVKCIHKQWPVMYRNHIWKQSPSPMCTLCSDSVETCDHVMMCKNTQMILHRKQALRTLKSSLYELQTYPLIVKQIMRILHQWINSFPTPYMNLDHLRGFDLEVAEAMNSQIKLGVTNMVRGIIPWKLQECQRKYYSTIPKKENGDGSIWSRRVIALFLQFSMSCWKYRCELFHFNNVNTAEKNLRYECTQLLYSLSRDKNRLHPNYWHLLSRKNAYFENARISNLQSWLRRIQLGITKQIQVEKTNITDIRKWLTRTINVENSNDTNDSNPQTQNELRNDEYLRTPPILAQLLL